MTHTAAGVRSRACSLRSKAIALLLLAAVGLGVLPFSVELPLVAVAGKNACRFEPIDVCGASDTCLGMLAETPVLPGEAVAVVAEPVVLPNPPEAPAALREGFAPGVYRPPRHSC